MMRQRPGGGSSSINHNTKSREHPLVLPHAVDLGSSGRGGKRRKRRKCRKSLVCIAICLIIIIIAGVTYFYITLPALPYYESGSSIFFQWWPSSFLRKGPSSSSYEKVDYRGRIGESCNYDGHCPRGSTCAIPSSSKSSSSLGVCEPIQYSSSESASKACQQACRNELELDEHFYQEEWAEIHSSQGVISKGRPAGCVLEYHRVPQGDRWDKREMQVRPSLLDEWMARRFRYVIRVDPKDPTNPADKTWISYCFNPCQSNADCATQNDGNVPGFVCQEGACQRNPDYWNRYDDNDNDDNKMVIITGATLDYFSALKNLVASAQYWAPNHKVVVYNLGRLGETHQNEIRSWKNVIALEWSAGVPKHYPPHVSEGKKYAWKPLILQETLTKYKSIFWLDAGSTLAGPITPVEKIVHRTGMFLVKGQDLDMELSSSKSYKWFNTSKGSLQTGPHFSGNTQAFLYPSRYYDTIVAPNAKCALDLNCIAPAGSSLGSHRYDQTTLSILSYHPKIRAPHYTEYLAADRTQLSNNLKKPSSKFVWTSRRSCSYYTKLMKL